MKKIGDYVHYRIRFENLGTANAINVVVKNEIDSNLFDIGTVEPISSSHEYETRINDNIVEFIFEGINLPFDDATNDGYLVYRIKSLSNLVVGDVLQNQADIYFDFNAPVITNLEETEFVTTLNIEDFESNEVLSIYPNPTSNLIYINSTQPIQYVEIYNSLGQLLSATYRMKKIDIKYLSSGLYLAKIKVNDNIITKKIIKK